METHITFMHGLYIYIYTYIVHLPFSYIYTFVYTTPTVYCICTHEYRTCDWSEQQITMSAMEGSLSKWTNVVNGWQYRWFVLDDNAGLLSYYTVRMFKYRTCSTSISSFIVFINRLHPTDLFNLISCTFKITIQYIFSYKSMTYSSNYYL